MNKKAVIILAHGSRNHQARESFLNMVEVVGKRAKGCSITPAFFSLGGPSLESVVQELVSTKYSEITIFPYFLFDGNHVLKDIPALVNGLQAAHPDVVFRLLDSLEHEPLMPEMIFERIWECCGQEKYLPGMEIERASLDFIQDMLDNIFIGAEQKIAARVVHSSADFSLGHSLRFHPQAVKAGLECLGRKKKIICDVNMVRSALTSCQDVLCAIDQPGAGQKALTMNVTRSAAGMEMLAPHLDGAMVVIGNAPTALWKVLDLAERKNIIPGLVVGVPVGFVGAAQSKEALIKSGLVYISNLGPKGGSPVAGAIVNAMLKL
ncbi:precorrin-8X methylmutase [Desulfonatronovibrio hydrogenovorans]|uniref:precorrin-8X methylmutase n=1 Tax=Desulfonatronovibrio hydrogenovorans TaxID=53245 RepID=UPI000A632956|nr:precorrin-8X methylmutase [Desulfonatronovibrio hydrogenovorans]